MKAAAILVAAALGAPPAAQPPGPVEGDFFLLAPGQELECAHPTGCVAMTPERLEALLQQAAATGRRQACRPTI